MIAALIIGRGNSRGIPRKNTMRVLGRPLMTYPIKAAKGSRYVDRIFLATEDPEIRRVGADQGVAILNLTEEMTTEKVLVEQVVVHGYEQIRQRIGDIEMLVFLFCNSATMSPELIDEGVEILRKDPTLDSAVSVSPYNEYSPVRAKRITADNLIVPYVDVNVIEGASCDRDSAATCYFCDCSLWVLRPKCMDLPNGELPFRWIGRRCAPIYQTGGLDIDHDYGIAMTEHWLRKHGFTEDKTPY
jgi:CMP-N-acetylneuraminic acid synthetase